MKKYAHYFKTGKKHILTVSESTRPIGNNYVFTSKREVVAKAKALNLIAYNF